MIALNKTLLQLALAKANERRECKECGELFRPDQLTDNECDGCYAERTDWDGIHGQD